MAKYSKFIVAVLGAVLTGLAVFAGIDLEAKGITADTIWNFVLPVLTAFGVWAVPNKTGPTRLDR